MKFLKMGSATQPSPRPTRTRRRLLFSLAVVCSLGVLSFAAAGAQAASGYVALGDSYASGDGTGVFYSSSGDCYQSPDAYPPLIASAKGYSLSFEACSGATSANVISNQLSPLSSSTGLVTVQVGGDDAGFTNVMEDCAAYIWDCSSAISTADSYIENTLPGNLNTLYTDIRSRAANAKVVVVGYPRLFDSSGDTCGVNLLTTVNALKLNTTASDLDSVLASEASEHGFTFVDPRTDFSSHELCSSSAWLNNVTYPIYESFHPTITGESQFASLIESALN
jgi:GDSL-like Lipase/Acylhydrolase family